MRRDTFQQRLHEATEAAVVAAASYVFNPLPALRRYFVSLLWQPGREPAPEGDCILRDKARGLELCERASAWSAEGVVDYVFVRGKVPAWINIGVVDADTETTYLHLEGCIRFTGDEERLYGRYDGFPPFVLHVPIPPSFGWDVARDGK